MKNYGKPSQYFLGTGPHYVLEAMRVMLYCTRQSGRMLSKFGLVKGEGNIQLEAFPISGFSPNHKLIQFCDPIRRREKIGSI